MEQYKDQYDHADDHYKQIEFVDAVIRVLVCLVIAAALVFAAGFYCGYAYADPLDRAFERHVERETKKLYRYEWKCTLAGSYFAPQCIRVPVRKRA